MNREAIGAVGEVGGAIAVVITLIYLAAQIRFNTMTNRTAALQTMSSQNADWLSLITKDEKVAEIFQSGQRDLDNLDGADRVRYGMLMTQFCRVFDAQLHQHQNAALSDDLWQASLRTIGSVMRRKGARDWWARYGYLYSEAFQGLIGDLLDDPDDHAPPLPRDDASEAPRS